MCQLNLTTVHYSGLRERARFLFLLFFSPLAPDCRVLFSKFISGLPRVRREAFTFVALQMLLLLLLQCDNKVFYTVYITRACKKSIKCLALKKNRYALWLQKKEEEAIVYTPSETSPSWLSLDLVNFIAAADPLHNLNTLSSDLDFIFPPEDSITAIVLSVSSKFEKSI